MNRRRFLAVTSATGAALLGGPPLRADDSSARKRSCTLGFSTYGMKRLKTEAAIAAVAKTGFDAIEMAVRPDWDAAPARMSAARRQQARRLLKDSGLKLTSLMEHLAPAVDKKQHAVDLKRLERVAELGADLTPKDQPLIQTTLGGGQWEQKKNFFRDRLGDWATVGKAAGTVIAIKPHRGGSMSRPSEAAWLIEQLDHTPWLRMVYDYSHYAFRNMPLTETIETALPITAHIAVKDAVQQGNRVVFKLPGAAGTIDYVALLKQFYAGGYRGDFSCEVSGMVSGKPGYDPIAAAQACYGALAEAFVEAGVRRLS